MKTKTLYTCEICHTDYADKEKALQCEKHHYTKLKIVDMRHLPITVPKMSNREGFPETITVKAENGETMVYKR